MNRTLQISFSLKNTYHVNSILYSLKQIPLVKKLLPEALYKVWGLKIFANVLSVLWELISVFLGKLLYLLTMVAGIGSLYRKVPGDQVFLHILLLLTIIGAFTNTSLFNPTRDKYYAMILMRMDAREYTLVNYTYSIIKVILGFTPFILWLGMGRGLPVWLCLLLPFSIAGVKLTIAAFSLWDYERRGFVYNENKISKYLWLCTAVLLGAAYGLPAAGIVLPGILSAVLMLVFIPAGAVGIRKLISFQDYREINQQMLSQMINQMDTVAQNTKKASEKTISTDISISSNRKGYEYLNELFIKRHQKILWNATKKIAFVCAGLICGVLLTLYLAPEIKKKINELILNWLPYFVFIMYAINRGTGFTRALFMNCDHSLLTYSFYKQPKFMLKLFQIRLREIMKINAVPAVIIGIGLSLILFFSGGTDNPVNYVVLIVSIPAMSLFFSVHYLTVYYLLQPYNAGTELKSATYQIVMSVTYLFCFYMTKLRMQTLLFGVMTIVFCILYSIIACILIYRLAPKTFKIRM
ncbi:hypothetical protein [Novisyntrophococcus fermenticellae]|uniref:hypothetical protein n=1 Tax=Novisyntrophococcus fermenticellae TaxID=2068655 RepID=UPI001E5DEA4B|nr:hypothetical protein [Novisyntrophococcus fermenticellae]